MRKKKADDWTPEFEPAFWFQSTRRIRIRNRYQSLLRFLIGRTR